MLAIHTLYMLSKQLSLICKELTAHGQASLGQLYWRGWAYNV